MTIFNSYVELPEGISWYQFQSVAVQNCMCSVLNTGTAQVIQWSRPGLGTPRWWTFYCKPGRTRSCEIVWAGATWKPWRLVAVAVDGCWLVLGGTIRIYDFMYIYIIIYNYNLYIYNIFTEKDAVRPCVLHCFPCSILQCFPLAVFSHHQRATIGHNMPKYAKIGHKGLNKQKTKKTKKTEKTKKNKKNKDF